MSEPLQNPQQVYDVLVVGGGVNGTGTARDCAMRGLKTALVEKRDVASGASGANSGMIHGGIRYLQTEPAVTKLSCINSGYIQKIAPHLLFRIPFIFPVRRKGAEPTPMERGLLYGAEVVFSMYDDYQPYKRGKPSSRLNAEETLSLEPGIPPTSSGPSPPTSGASIRSGSAPQMRSRLSLTALTSSSTRRLSPSPRDPTGESWALKSGATDAPSCCGRAPCSTRRGRGPLASRSWRA